ncbi:hypothetical protein Btru_050920 [Bulinus truncatus]|nr:hypothetical protein Btru_050920 [Bulinus truncatus]
MNIPWILPRRDEKNKIQVFMCCSDAMPITEFLHPRPSVDEAGRMKRILEDQRKADDEEELTLEEKVRKMAEKRGMRMLEDEPRWREAVKQKMEVELSRRVREALETPPLERMQRRKQMSRQQNNTSDMNAHLILDLSDKERDYLRTKHWKALQAKKQMGSEDSAFSSQKNKQMELLFKDQLARSNHDEYPGVMGLDSLSEGIKDIHDIYSSSFNRFKVMRPKARHFYTKEGMRKAMKAGHVPSGTQFLDDAGKHMDKYGIIRNNDGPYWPVECMPLFPTPRFKWWTNLDPEPLSDLLPGELGSSYASSKESSSSDGTAQAHREVKKQPIIIQNFELLAPDKSRPKGKSLSVASLCLTAATLRRQGLNVGDKEHDRPLLLAADDRVDSTSETGSWLYKSYGPSSSLVESPLMSTLVQHGEKLKTRKQVTFVERLNSPHDPPAVRNGLKGTASNRSEFDPIFKADDKFDVCASHKTVAINHKDSVSSRYSFPAFRPQSTAFTPDEKYNSSNDAVYKCSLTQTVKLPDASTDSSSGVSNDINDRATFYSKDNKLSDLSMCHAEGGKEADNVVSPLGNRLQVSNIDSHRTEEESEKSTEGTETWYRKEKSEIEADLVLNQVNFNRLLSHNESQQDVSFQKESTVIDTDIETKLGHNVIKEPEAYGRRKTLKVSFLKDEPHPIPKVNIPFYRNQSFLTNSDNRRNMTNWNNHEKCEGSSLDFQNKIRAKTAISRLEFANNISLNSADDPEMRSKVECHSNFLMRNYSTLGERRSDLDNELIALGKSCMTPSPENSSASEHYHEKSSGSVANSAGRKKGRETGSSRSRSCSATDRGSSVHGRASSGLLSDRYIVDFDSRFSARTARNKRLEQIILSNTISGGHSAVERRLKSATNPSS